MVFLLALVHVCHRIHLAFLTLMSKLFSSASSIKIFACSARHDTSCEKPAVPRHLHPRGPSFVFQWRACVRCIRLALRVVRARLDRGLHSQMYLCSAWSALNSSGTAATARPWSRSTAAAIDVFDGQLFDGKARPEHRSWISQWRVRVGARLPPSPPSPG